MLDIKKVQEEAEAEVKKELMNDAKEQVKHKLHELAAAKQVVKNVELELKDLYAEIGQSSS